MKINSLLRIFLFIAICLLAIAPIVLHHHLEYSNGHLLDEKRLPGWSASPKLKGFSHIKTVQHDPNKTEFLTLALDYDEHRSNILLPPDIGRAGSFLLENALRPRPVWDEAIDPVVEHERCKQYFPDNNDNKGLYTANQKRRRIFLGSLIADDSWHTLAAIAMESYGIYTAVVFVESNRTQTGDARTLRFVNGTVDHQVLAESNLFGPNTAVHMDQFFFEGEIDGGGLIREHRQRDAIFKLWKQAGMTDEDVGVLSDADETPSRDFLRAIQICDIPQLRVQDQNCHSPKLVVSSMVFEGSPECMTVTRKWMHPDFMLGKCIEHVGDDKFRLTASQRQREFAWRRDKFSAKFNYSDWPREKNCEFLNSIPRRVSFIFRQMSHCLNLDLICIVFICTVVMGSVPALEPS